MFSEPQTPTFFEDSFSETKSSVFDIGSSGVSGIQAVLNKRLGPEYVSQRPAPGGGPKLTYVEGWKIIGLANEVFGYNGWSSTVTKIETDFVDMDPDSRRYCIGVTAIVKVTLRDGTYHEDIGYGTADNLKSKGAALDKAKKEAVTDGVKRALRNFGNLLGLCLYEKSFTQEVVKIKPQHPKFDESDLHRRTSLSSTGAPHDVSLTTFTEPLDAIPSIPPQIRSASSKPSPLRNPGLDAKARLAVHEQRLASGSRTGVDTAGVRPAQSRHQTPCGNWMAPQNKARSPQDKTLPHQVQLPQQGSSTSASSSKQFDTRSAAPPVLKVSDSDDTYFNDEDNDALLALEDSALHGAVSCGTLAAAGDSAQGRVCGAGLDVTNESSGSAAGTRTHVGTAVSTSSNRTSAPLLDQPMSNLRRTIRASTASLAAAGVKRPAEVLQSHPQPIVMSPAQVAQQQQGRREPLSDLPIQGGTDVKRIKR